MLLAMASQGTGSGSISAGFEIQLAGLIRLHGVYIEVHQLFTAVSADRANPMGVMANIAWCVLVLAAAAGRSGYAADESAPANMGTVQREALVAQDAISVVALVAERVGVGGLRIWVEGHVLPFQE